jgi:Ca-activated chloride channel family protein
MLHFANPAFLWLLLAVPPLVWWQLRQRRAAVRHPAAGLLAGLPAGRARRARWGGALLRGLALLLQAVALAGPRWPDLRTRIATEGIAIMMVVDTSGSMNEPDFDWNGAPAQRLEAARRVFELFVAGGDLPEGMPDGGLGRFEGRPTDLVGLVTFGTRAEPVCPLTLSHAALLRLLKAARPVRGEAETNISDGVALGLHRLQSAGPRRKVLVLLTDGEHNQVNPPSGWTPRQAAQVAASLGVPIYAIDAGPAGTASPGAESASPPEVRQQAVLTLKELAYISKGRYFAARDTVGLLQACQTIDRLERAEIQSFHYRRYHEAYPWLALSSFALYAAVLVLELTVWRRLP